VPKGNGGEPLTTASGGSFVRGEINRNKQAPQCGVAPIEVAEEPESPLILFDEKKPGQHTMPRSFFTIESSVLPRLVPRYETDPLGE